MHLPCLQLVQSKHARLQRKHRWVHPLSPLISFSSGVCSWAYHSNLWKRWTKENMNHLSSCSYTSTREWTNCYMIWYYQICVYLSKSLTPNSVSTDISSRSNILFLLDFSHAIDVVNALRNDHANTRVFRISEDHSSEIILFIVQICFFQCDKGSKHMMDWQGSGNEHAWSQYAQSRSTNPCCDTSHQSQGWLNWNWETSSSCGDNECSCSSGWGMVETSFGSYSTRYNLRSEGTDRLYIRCTHLSWSWMKRNPWRRWI